jgi:outer membrane protein assembly factor BamB
MEPWAIVQLAMKEDSVTPRHRALLVLACLVFVMPALACGASAHFPPLLTTTLPPSVAPFTVATLTGDSVQLRAGSSGQLLWQRTFPQAQSVAGLVQNGVIYRSASGSPLVAALRADDGSLLWQFGECAASDDSISILGGILYATCSSERVSSSVIAGDTLYALDARTGRVRWSAHAAHLRAVLAPSLVIAETSVGLEGLRAASGTVLWTHKTTIQTGPVPPGVPFVVMAGRGLIAYSPDGVTVEALRSSDGSLLWSTVVATTEQENPGWAVLAITPSVVMVYSIYGVVALDRVSGIVRWQRREDYIGIQLSTTVGPDQIIYAGSYSLNEAGQELGAYDASDGSPLWPQTVHMGDQTTLWLCGTTLYAVDFNYVEALRTLDGGYLWNDRVDIVYSVAAALPVVAIGTVHSVYLLNAPDGKLVWKVPVEVTGEYRQPLQVLLISQAGQPLACNQTS